MLKHLEIKQALLLNSENLIIEQIKIREENIKDMVGWLYPSILQGEIDKLYKRLEDIRNPVGNFEI